MRTFIKRLLLFIPAAFIIYSIFIYLWANFFPLELQKNLKFPFAGNGHMFTRLREAETYTNIDVLFIGSSHAYRGFDPRTFDSLGIKTFNLGSSSQTPIQSNYLLHRFIGKLNPKSIVIEVYPGVFELDGVESSIDIIANDVQIDFRLALNNPHIYVFNALLLKCIKNSFGIDKGFSEGLKKGADTYIKGGFVERKEGNFKKVQYNFKKWNLKKRQVKSLKDLLQNLKDRNVPYLLVQAPMTQSLYNSYTNNNEFDSIMHQLGPYINYNKILNMNDSLHFFDAHHLNQQGVELFNKEILKLFQKGRLSTSVIKQVE